MFPWRRKLTRKHRLYILQRIHLILISGRRSWARTIPSIDFQTALIAAERKAYDHARTFDTYVCLIFTLINNEARRQLQHQQQQRTQEHDERSELRSEL